MRPVHITLAALSVLALCACYSEHVQAAPNWHEIRKSIVIVKASGVSTTLGNQRLYAWGSGFFIDEQGGILTSYHLVEQLAAHGGRAMHLGSSLRFVRRDLR